MENQKTMLTNYILALRISIIPKLKHIVLKPTVSVSVSIKLCRKSAITFYSDKKFYNSLDELQTDIDNWLVSYNNARPHSGKHCFGKTPMQSFTDSLYIAKDKNIGNIGNIDKNIGNIERISDNLMIAHQAA
nr:hypothetical protein RMONA_3830 [Rickettsia monacensis IrR/Munich]